MKAASNLWPVAFEEKAGSVPQTVVVARPRSDCPDSKQERHAKSKLFGKVEDFHVSIKRGELRLLEPLINNARLTDCDYAITFNCVIPNNQASGQAANY